MTRKNKCIIFIPLVGLFLSPRSSPGTDTLLWVKQSRREKKSLAFDAITISKLLTIPKNQISDHARGIYKQYF